MLFAPCSSALADGFKEWESLRDEHERLQQQGLYEQALAIGQKALALVEVGAGKDHPATALSLSYLVVTYGSLGQYNKALPLQERALAIRDKALGPEHPDTVQSLNNLAYIYAHVGEYDKALPLQLRALAIAEKVLGPDHTNTAFSLNNLASTYDSMALYEKALLLHLRALAVREKTLGMNHLDTAQSLNNLASTYSSLAQYDKALPLQLRSLVIQEKVHGPDHPDTAWTLNNLALTYGSLGQHEKALPLQLRALAINEKSLGSNHPATAATLGNLAFIYGRLAQFDNALPLEQKVLAIREISAGPDHPDTAVSLSNLANTYIRLGQHEKALALHQRALAIREKTLGLDHPDTSSSLTNMAATYSVMTQYDRALSLRLRALAINEKTLGPDHPETAVSLGNLASTYDDLAQYDNVFPLELRALAITEKALGPDHPDTATRLNNLASTYSSLAKYDKALPLHQRALAIREKAFGSDHPETASSWANIAYIFSKTGKPDAATIFLKNAVNAYQSQRDRISRIGPGELQSYTGSIAPTYRALAALLVEQDRLPEAEQVLDMLKEDEQFEFIRRSENGDPRKTRVGYTPTEQRWMTRYREIADKLAALGAEEQALQKAAKVGLTPEQKDRQKALFADLAVAQKAFESFVGEMRDGFVAKGAARAVEVSETSEQATRESQNLLKLLGDDAVLLQYYVTDDKVGMLLTTPGVQLARSSAVKARELNRQIAEFRRLLRDPKSDPKPAAQALYQLLVSPVAKDLDDAGAKTVMLSLDGTLRYLPFGALHDGKQYLAQRWNLPIYTSVAKAKLRDTVTPKWQAAGLGVTRAVGDFAALPAVKGEMVSIVQAGKTGVLPGEVYLDEAFNALRLKDVAKRKFQLLHVASHFRFSPGTEVNSFLLLGDGQHLTLGDIRTQDYRFDNVDLLTLSACDTGLGGGRDEQGREIEGFGVIAQQQGAKAVLATLWPVADQSTAELMGNLYRSRQEKGLTKIEALRQAQISLSLQPKYSHPFYWAPFILMGNWK
jgi:CHAT domain-containing protein